MKGDVQIMADRESGVQTLKKQRRFGRQNGPFLRSGQQKKQATLRSAAPVGVPGLRAKRIRDYALIPMHRRDEQNRGR